ncbi:MAG TPA: universal stress protein [Bacteroidia bacterium]
MKTILVPTDFSHNAECALTYAVALAKKEKAKLILLHAYHLHYSLPTTSDEYYTQAISAKENIANEYQRQLCHEIKREHNVDCEYKSKYGLAVDVILETAGKIRADLIIMGTKGASGLQQLFLGSNTAKVIEEAKCPVIAVPAEAKFKGIKKITFATDYFESDISSLKKMVEIATLFHSRITIIHVSDDEFTLESEKDLMQTFKAKIHKQIDYENIHFEIVHGNDLERSLAKHIEQENPDLLAMSTHHRSFLDKLFEGSITKRMAFHTRVPLLVFHHKTESVVFL